MTTERTTERTLILDLLADYGALLDHGNYAAWLGLFAPECTYNVVPRENYDRGLPVGLIYCDSRAMLEDRIMALREANKYNIHTDRHLIGLPRLSSNQRARGRRARDRGALCGLPDRSGGCDPAVRDRPLPGPAGACRCYPQDPRQARPARHLRGPNSARHSTLIHPCERTQFGRRAPRRLFACRGREMNQDAAAKPALARLAPISIVAASTSTSLSTINTAHSCWDQAPGAPGPWTVITIRRFFARLAGVSLGATGWVSPNPLAEMTFGLMPWEIR